MPSVIWTAFMIVVLIALVIFLIKFLLCNCMLIRNGEDSAPILPGRREAFWIEYDRLRMQAMWARQPPPDFEEALRSSRPVSYLEVDDGPPPTYDDFLKSQSPSPENPCPLSQGRDFSILGQGPEAENVVRNSFEDDFVLNLNPSAQESDMDLATAVFRVNVSKTENANHSEV